MTRTLILSLVLVGPLLAQPAPPKPLSFQPPTDAGFDPNSALGKSSLLPAQAFAPPEPLPPAPIIPGIELPPPAPVWAGSAEFGLSGSDGNSDTLKIRTGLDLKRKAQDNLFSLNTWYGLSRQMGRTSENKALITARDEILFVDSPWSLFGQGAIEYDQFRDFTFRVAKHAGFGYLWVKDDRTYFKTRAGFGFQREVGGPRNMWVPEALLGFDFEQRISARSRFVSAVDWYPNLDRIGQYRVRARAAYEILIDPELGLTLRFGLQDRYDSNPGRAKRNDVDYFATLLWQF